ncbi:protein arginine N-methyltransferase 7-like [Babylonia areolata]|uniref:protein arginine N-methyltransferase 7-like n=1 Tax=Babylonia areolata TaxID=304850 RepID=UPI003FD06C44
MIRLWTVKTIEQLHKLRSVTLGFSRAMESGEKVDRAELNKGVDGVAKPLDSPEGSRVLMQYPNIVTGEIETVWSRSDYDYQQEIARSSYADMLHDTERNEKYYSALSKAIQVLRDRGQRVQVLDIGTGTGLLSMMAAAEGADSITACEAFEPMANCATAVIEENGYGDRISLIRARSTDITVGDGKGMDKRANLLVTEVFDTELIGEGAIGTYTHAHENLLQEDCLTVPRAAVMYAQPVCSDHIRRWNTLRPVQVAQGQTIQVPASYSECGGVPSLHDLQLSQISPSLFTPVAPPVKVFRFDFSKRGALKKDETSEVSVEAQVDGKVDAVFVWWDLEMDPEGEIILSCAPSWAHPQGDSQPWRDHWIQSIFYPSHCLEVSRGETFRLISYHDEYSLWFETALPGQEVDLSERPVCECSLHMAVSRSRLGMLSDESRNSVFLQTLRKHVSSTTVCVCICDFSLLPFMAAMLGARKVFVLQSSKMGLRVLKDIIKENQLEDKIIILDKTAQKALKEDFQGLQVDLVMGEPYFQTCSLPWDSLQFWYAAHALRPMLSPGAQVLPGTITVYAVAMHFEHLWKIRAPVGLCQGFMLNIFDTLIKSASGVADQQEETQPLWEYPGKAMSQPVTVFTLSGEDLQPEEGATGSNSLQLTCEVEDVVNGVALWCDYDFGQGHTLSTGPLHTPVVGKLVEWNMYCQQAVYLNCSPCSVTPGYTLDFSVKFVPNEGKLMFDWSF